VNYLNTGTTKRFVESWWEKPGQHSDKEHTSTLHITAI